MTSPYAILGISESSTLDEARAAYRRGAQKHHPDKGGNTETFKSLKAAFESIESGKYQRPDPKAPATKSKHFYSAPMPAWERRYPRPGEAYDPDLHFYTTAPPKHSEHHRPKPRTQNPIQGEPVPLQKKKSYGHFVSRVSISEALQGFIVQCNIDGTVKEFKMPRGVPDGIRLEFPFKDGTVDISAFFSQSEYTFISANLALKEGTIVNSDVDAVLRTKDLRKSLEVPVKYGNIPKAKTYNLTDIDGSLFEVRVSSNTDISKPMVFPGRGYVDWYIGKKGCGPRGDLIINLIPTEEMGEGKFN
jgi:hypothetical protein